VTASPVPSHTSQVQPEPNRLTPASLTCAFSCSRSSNVSSIAWASAPEGERDQHRRQTHVESKELHARFPRNEDEREDDAQAEVRKEEEQDQRSLLFTSAQLITFHHAST